MDTEADSDGTTTPEGMVYEFVLADPVGIRTARALGDVEIVGGAESGVRLRGRVVDQCALHGVLERIRDLGLELIDVHRLD